MTDILIRTVPQARSVVGGQARWFGAWQRRCASVSLACGPARGRWLDVSSKPRKLRGNEHRRLAAGDCASQRQDAVIWTDLRVVSAANLRLLAAGRATRSRYLGIDSGSRKRFGGVCVAYRWRALEKLKILLVL